MYTEIIDFLPKISKKICMLGFSTLSLSFVKRLRKEKYTPKTDTQVADLKRESMSHSFLCKRRRK